MNRTSTKSSNASKTKNPPVVLAARAVPPPPGETAPDAPAGFSRLTAPQARSLMKGIAGEVAVAPALARELESSSSFEKDLGPRAPDRRVLAASLRDSAQWSLEVARARAWLDYVETQKLLAWDATTRAVLAATALYEHAAARDPTVAGRYPALEAFARVRRDVSARGHATLARKRRAPPTPPPGTSDEAA